jgi:hypothetical protein
MTTKNLKFENPVRLGTRHLTFETLIISGTLILVLFSYTGKPQLEACPKSSAFGFYGCDLK